MLLPEEMFAVLEGESGYDLKISKSEMTIPDGISSRVSRKSGACVYIHKNNLHQ